MFRFNVEQIALYIIGDKISYRVVSCQRDDITRRNKEEITIQERGVAERKRGTFLVIFQLEERT